MIIFFHNSFFRGSGICRGGSAAGSQGEQHAQNQQYSKQIFHIIILSFDVMVTFWLQIVGGHTITHELCNCKGVICRNVRFLGQNIG